MLIENIVYYTDSLPERFAVSNGSGNQSKLITTIGMLTVGKDVCVTDDYKLKESLVAEVRFENENYVVVEYRTDEYGIGESIEEAQQDLLDSLVDYLRSLEKRETILGDKEQSRLQIIRDILAK